MFFSIIKSKLLQLYPNFTRTSPSIFINANKNPIIRKITTTSFVNRNFDNTMFARTFTTVKSISRCPRKIALQLKTTITKFRKTSYVILAMSLFLKIERVPFSDRRHLVIRYSKHLSLFRIPSFVEVLVEFIESKFGKVLPTADPKTLRFTLIARKLGQGMHDVLPLKRDFKVVAYEPGLKSESNNPGFIVGRRQTGYNNTTPKRWSGKEFMRRYRTYKHLEGREWKVNVLDSPGFFAFGVFAHIFIYSGLLDNCSDEEVAFIIGHEMGHTIGRHRMDDLMWYLPKRIVIATAMVIRSFLQRHDYILNDQSKNKIHDIVTIFSCPRREFEADHIGMMLMASAGYDPQAAQTFLSKFACLPLPPHSTHPNGCDRMKYLKNHERMNNAMNLYKDTTSSS